MILPCNSLLIDWEDNDMVLHISNILRYIENINCPYYYLFFGYGLGNVDMSKYYEEYSELMTDHGFIKLKDQDKTDPKFISDILFEYQTVALYINNKQNLDKIYSFPQIRDYLFHHVFEGYSILGTEENSIILCKDTKMPDWDTDRMHIPLDNIWIEQLDKRWTNIPLIVDSKKKSHKILEVIDSVFSENMLIPLTKNSDFEITDIAYLSSIIITSKIQTELSPKIVIKGDCVNIYILSSHRILSIMDINNDIQIGILKQSIEYLFFYHTQIIYENKKLISVSFINKNGKIGKIINQPDNILDRIISIFSKKEIFDYKPICKIER